MTYGVENPGNDLGQAQQCHWIEQKKPTKYTHI
jgi:hypothetical protein